MARPLKSVGFERTVFEHVQDVVNNDWLISLNGEGRAKVEADKPKNCSDHKEQTHPNNWLCQKVLWVKVKGFGKVHGSRFLEVPASIPYEKACAGNKLLNSCVTVE